MVRITLAGFWIGVGLTLLCLGIGGCHCPERADTGPIACSFCDRLPPCPTICGPCYGYQPTCWMSWPDCCVPCPPPVQAMRAGGIPGGDIPPGEGAHPPMKEMERVPLPQEEARSNIEAPAKAKQPPKAIEPPKPNEPPANVEKPKTLQELPPEGAKPARVEKLQPSAAKTPTSKAAVLPPQPNEPTNPEEPRPAAEKPPKAEEPHPKAEELPKAGKLSTEIDQPPIASIEPSMGDGQGYEVEHAGWEYAPLPLRSTSSPAPAAPSKTNLQVQPTPKLSPAPRDLDSKRADELITTNGLYSAALLPERKNILAETR
jgi:hypothetical protein